MDERIKVGQMVYFRGNRRTISEAEITNVGRLYFTINVNRNSKVEIGSLISKSNYGSHRVYLDKTELSDEIETEVLSQKIRYFVTQGYGSIKLPLSVLRTISELIDVNELK